MTIERLWNSIPTSKEKAVSYFDLQLMWEMNLREVRRTLQKLSTGDNGDDYVLIRSGSVNGFYKTDDKEIIARYRKEVLAKGRSLFAPVTKCNRILKETTQLEVWNNLKAVRIAKNMKQTDVCKELSGIDVALLSRYENGVCIPTPSQVKAIAEVYGVPPSDLYRYSTEYDACESAEFDL